jgi:hypothetical protein
MALERGQPECGGPWRTKRIQLVKHHPKRLEISTALADFPHKPQRRTPIGEAIATVLKQEMLLSPPRGKLGIKAPQRHDAATRTQL